MTRALDSRRKAALMSCAGTRLTARFDLAPLGKIAAQPLHVLVIDFVDVIHAEKAHFATSTRTSAPATAASTAETATWSFSTAIWAWRTTAIA